MPLDWAVTQNNLGNALLALGERERGTVRLEEAVAAYRMGLDALGNSDAEYLAAAARMNLRRVEAMLPEKRWRDGV
jgi:hypothetical protein